MRTKKKNVVFANETPEPKAPAENAPEAKSAGEKINERVSFYVDENGQPQWDRVAPKTVEALKQILGNSETQKVLGVKPPESGKEVYEVAFDATEADAILDLLQGVDALAASKTYNVPMEVCVPAFTFTPLQREKITPPLTRILNKWGPAMLKTWKDEIGLGLIMLSTVNVQIRVMHAMEAKRKAQGPQAVPNKPVEINKSVDREATISEEQPASNA